VQVCSAWWASTRWITSSCRVWVTTDVETLGIGRIWDYLWPMATTQKDSADVEPPRFHIGDNINMVGNHNVGKIVDVVLFAASAVGSGVLGNAAYDALKGAVEKLLGRRVADPTDLGVRETAARLAVQARCNEVGFRVPGDTEACRVRVRAERMGTVFEFEYQDLFAEVRVPNGELDGQMLQVLLRKSIE
jgi:hypothetical protein